MKSTKKMEAGFTGTDKYYLYEEPSTWSPTERIWTGPFSTKAGAETYLRAGIKTGYYNKKNMIIEMNPMEMCC